MPEKGYAPDYPGLRDSLEVAINQELAKLIDGEVASLSGPVRDAANRLSVAIRRGPTAQKEVDEIKDQILVALLADKVKAKKSLHGVMDVVIGTGLNLLFQGAIGGLAAIRPVSGR